MKVVKFNNGKYGLRIGFWLTGYSFLGEDCFKWNGSEYIVKYCQFDTIEEVEAISRKYPSNHKVIKQV